MSSKSTQSSIAQEIQGTDLGKFLYDNRTLILSLFAVALVGLFGSVAMNYVNSESLKSFDQKAYEFRKSVLIPYQEGKIDGKRVLSESNILFSEYKGKKFLGPLILEIAQNLHAKEAYGEVESLLTPHINDLSRSQQVYYLLNLVLAATYEDSKKFTQAIEILNKLVSFNILEDKIYFDLGRLYKLNGNKDSAKKSFEYVLSKFPQSQFKTMTELYLSEL